MGWGSLVIERDCSRGIEQLGCWIDLALHGSGGRWGCAMLLDLESILDSLKESCV